MAYLLVQHFGSIVILMVIFSFIPLHIAKLNTLDWRRAAEGVRPILERPSDIEMMTRNNVVKLLDKRQLRSGALQTGHKPGFCEKAEEWGVIEEERARGRAPPEYRQSSFF